jgi:hypothetical protein
MCRTSRAGTSPGGDIRRTRVQAAKDRMHAMRIGRASGTVLPRHRRVEDALPYVPGRKRPLSSRSVEQCGHGGPGPSRDGWLGRTVSPRALKYIVHRGLRPSYRVRWGDRAAAVRKERQTPVPAPNLQRDLMAGCSSELRQVGRDGIPAVRNNTGQRGLCPSHKVAWEGRRPHGPQEYRPCRTMPLPRHSHGAEWRAESAGPVWAASWRSAGRRP